RFMSRSLDCRRSSSTSCVTKAWFEREEGPATPAPPDSPEGGREISSRSRLLAGELRSDAGRRQHIAEPRPTDECRNREQAPPQGPQGTPRVDGVDQCSQERRKDDRAGEDQDKRSSSDLADPPGARCLRDEAVEGAVPADNAQAGQPDERPG